MYDIGWSLASCILSHLHCRRPTSISSHSSHHVEQSRLQRMADIFGNGDEKSPGQREHLLTNIEEEEHSCRCRYDTSKCAAKSRASLILLRLVLFMAYSVALSYIVATVITQKWREPESTIRPCTKYNVRMTRYLLTCISIPTICYQVRSYTVGAWQYSQSVRWGSTSRTWQSLVRHSGKWVDYSDLRL